MQTVIVKYALPGPVPRATMLTGFEQAAPMFQSVPGLVRKYFCYDEAAHTGHSVYLFETSDQAHAFFGEAFLAQMKQIFGTVPELFYVDTLMIADNAQGAVTPLPA